MNAFNIIVEFRTELLAGLLVTLKLCLIIWTLGISLGTALGWLSAKYKTWVGLPSRVLSFVLSGIPILVFLFWAHYPLQSIIGVVIDPFKTAAVVLSIVNVFAVADTVRGLLRDLPTQYKLAAMVCGLNAKTTFLKIELPLVGRHLIPTLLPLQVAMLHASLFASLISVPEIFRVTQRINASIYSPVETYTALGVFFLIVSLPLNGLAIYLRTRLTRNISEA